MEAAEPMTDDRRTELARSYLMLQVPVLKSALALSDKDTGRLMERLDWSVIMEPMVSAFAAALTEEELSRAVAWVESPLYAKLASMQGTVSHKVQAGLIQALGKYLAEVE